MKKLSMPQMDIDGDRPGVQTKAAAKDIVWMKVRQAARPPVVGMVARRAGKVATALLLVKAGGLLGLPPEASIAIGAAYLPLEKGANVIVERRNGGKARNFDLGTLLVAILKLVVRVIETLKQKGK